MLQHTIKWYICTIRTTLIIYKNFQCAYDWWCTFS
jgi:hypothetical protein